MKDVHVLMLLMLLNTQTTKVCCLPYQADSNGQCHNPQLEYVLDGSNLCCRKCLPGERLVNECSETADTVCEQCQTGQFMESWNYSPNCFSCPKCKANKGLQYSQNCSFSMSSRCVCQPGMYCIFGFDDPYCKECWKYTSCKAGYGVSVPGTASSNVKCAQCPHGTFSSKNSYTESCQPHTDCHGRAVVREGNATSDTLCDPLSTTLPQPAPDELHASTVYTTTGPMMSTASVSSDSTLSDNSSVSVAAIDKPTKNKPLTTDTKLVVAITCVTGLILLSTVILLVLCKAIRRKDTERFHPKIDANGNCESADKINPDYLMDTQLTSFTINSPEHKCLLEKGEACSDLNQSSNSTEILTRTEGCSSQECQESIGPLQSTTVLHDPHSDLSEPMSLLSNTEPVSPQFIIPPPYSSQPTSPQLISPIASNPHVNVNITFHIGNGACGTPSTMSTDDNLPLAKEEECFSVPQQEDGKQSLMAVQESTSYSMNNHL
ncbi:hypothetical protein LDENG_00002230 [Lucifuga dentata]|nr:hypothetical protein LDENG_00002230 [Lucifuga dentata]